MTFTAVTGRDRHEKTTFFTLLTALVLIPATLLLDCCTIFTSLTTIKWSSVVLVLTLGLRTNISHGIATAVTLLVFSKPLLEKLDRVKLKYGLIGSGDV